MLYFFLNKYKSHVSVNGATVVQFRLEKMEDDKVDMLRARSEITTSN